MHAVIPQAVVRIRRLLARRPWIYWSVCAALALAVGLGAFDQMSALESARNSWGSTRQVLVAVGDHAPGDPVHGKLVSVPEAMVPDSALAEVPTAATSRQRIAEGEVIVRGDVTPTVGPASRAASGQQVVGIGDSLARNVTIGLDVVVVADGVVLADGATVVDLTDEIIFVAVMASQAPAVALAAKESRASVVFVP